MKLKITDFITGIISLIFSQILIKIFGIIYSLYITNKTGFADAGNAIYMSGYQIYALLLTVSSIGVPNAISKLISEKNAINDYINGERIFKIAIFLFAIIGLAGCIILFSYSEYIANVILEIPDAKLSLMVLSPAIFFVSVSSVIKGYCNGKNKIFITAKAQLLEQIIKSILTILLVEIFAKVSNNNTKIMAAVANLATTIATFFSFIYIICKYLKIKKIHINGIIYKKERIINNIKNVLKITIPMTLNAIVSSLGKNVDSITIVRILKRVVGEEKAILKYGILSAKVDILVSLPLSFNTAIATSLIPEIARKKSKNDMKGLTNKIEFSLLITLIIGIPYAFGINCYSNQIFYLLFPNANNGANLLKISSIGIIFSMLVQTINAILQGIGKNQIPLYASTIGLIVKIICNITLIPINEIQEKGAIIGNICSAVTSFIIVYNELRKNIAIKNKVYMLATKPIIGSLIMIIISLSGYNYFVDKNINLKILTSICIIISVIIYVFWGIVTKMIKKEDVCERLENTGF